MRAGWRPGNRPGRRRAARGAAGDALGVPYEYGSRPLRVRAGRDARRRARRVRARAVVRRHRDGVCIAEVAATGADLRSPEALEQIAQGFLRWYDQGPPDIGNQTRSVLGNTGVGVGAAERMLAVSRRLHERTGHTAGNGSLMRTAPVALAHLGDADAIAAAARAVSALTHFDPFAGDACVLWCLAIDHAVRTGELDIRVGLPYVDDYWAPLLDEAETVEPVALPAQQRLGGRGAARRLVRDLVDQRPRGRLCRRRCTAAATPTRSRRSPALCSARRTAVAPCRRGGGGCCTAGRGCGRGT